MDTSDWISERHNSLTFTHVYSSPPPCGLDTQLKGRVDECNEAAEIAVHQQSARYNKTASELIQRDSHIRELKVSLRWRLISLRCISTH